MQVVLEPRLADRLREPGLRRDWKAVARRVAEAGGRWILVHTDAGYARGRGVQAEVRDRLARCGVRAQVVALHGIGEGPRPWQGWAVFARIPPDEGVAGRAVHARKGKIA